MRKNTFYILEEYKEEEYKPANKRRIYFKTSLPVHPLSIRAKIISLFCTMAQKEVLSKTTKMLQSRCALFVPGLSPWVTQQYFHSSTFQDEQSRTTWPHMRSWLHFGVSSKEGGLQDRLFSAST